jgi:hypothetical protein
MLHRLPFIPIALFLLLAGAVGCGTCGPSPRAPTDGSQEKNSTAASPAVAAEGQDVAGLKELDEADRKLAEKQKYCPKTGELFGSMGKPYKITLASRTFFLCCEGCEEAVKKEPEKYLKKLDELMKDK